MNWNKRDYETALNSVIDGSFDVYNYKIARYYDDITYDLRNTFEYNPYDHQSFAARQDSDLLESSSVNVIKSVIDALVSKLANQKVRPYFTPINGTYKTRQIVKQVQRYFDLYYDEQKVHEKVTQAFRNACIFGIGYLYVNPFNYKIEVPTPASVGILNSESSYGEPKVMMIKYPNYPTSLLKEYEIDGNGNYVEFSTIIDIADHKVTYYVNGTAKKSVEYKSDTLPIVPVYYNRPVLGLKTNSIVDELEGIQTQINMICSKMSAADQMMPANTTYVMEGSTLTENDLNNKTGNIYRVKFLNNGGSLPVVNVAPPAHDPEWRNELEFYIRQAYEIIGISQLSAMSKKPSGLNSGAALQSMEDIESDRFETQLTQYVNSYIDLAKKLIAVFPEDEDILPKSENTAPVTWKDIKKQTSLFKVQYSAATALSKDPAEKLKQILQLSQVGLIGPAKIAQYLDTPDLEDAYYGASAVNDGIQRCIQNAIENENYEIPEFVNYQQLAQEISITENQLYSAQTGNAKTDKEIVESLSRVMKLEDALLTIMEENGFIEQEANMEEPLESESGLTVANENQAIMANDITNQVEQPTNSDLTSTVNSPLPEEMMNEANNPNMNANAVEV